MAAVWAWGYCKAIAVMAVVHNALIQEYTNSEQSAIRSPFSRSLTRQFSRNLFVRRQQSFGTTFSPQSACFSDSEVCFDGPPGCLHTYESRIVSGKHTYGRLSCHGRVLVEWSESGQMDNHLKTERAVLFNRESNRRTP